jgi:hypothetical protein
MLEYSTARTIRFPLKWLLNQSKSTKTYLIQSQYLNTAQYVQYVSRSIGFWTNQKAWKHISSNHNAWIQNSTYNTFLAQLASEPIKKHENTSHPITMLECRTVRTIRFPLNWLLNQSKSTKTHLIQSQCLNTAQYVQYVSRSNGFWTNQKARKHISSSLTTLYCKLLNSHEICSLSLTHTASKRCIAD